MFDQIIIASLIVSCGAALWFSLWYMWDSLIRKVCPFSFLELAAVALTIFAIAQLIVWGIFALWTLADIIL